MPDRGFGLYFVLYAQVGLALSPFSLCSYLNTQITPESSAHKFGMNTWLESRPILMQKSTFTGKSKNISGFYKFLFPDQRMFFALFSLWRTWKWMIGLIQKRTLKSVIKDPPVPKTGIKNFCKSSFCRISSSLWVCEASTNRSSSCRGSRSKSRNIYHEGRIYVCVCVPYFLLLCSPTSVSLSVCVRSHSFCAAITYINIRLGRKGVNFGNSLTASGVCYMGSKNEDVVKYFGKNIVFAYAQLDLKSM